MHEDPVHSTAVADGQVHIGHLVPEQLRHPFPLVLIPGAGLTGACFGTTPDGRPGWTSYFTGQGYEVYWMDPVAHGSRPAPEYVERSFTAPARYNTYPQARLHTQWPGTGLRGDPVFEAFYASMVPTIPDGEAATRMRAAVGALLREIGPAVLVTHSQSGMFSWPIADDQPDLIAGSILLEGAQNVVTMLRLGPPHWFGYGAVKAPWGITNLPLTYDPPVADPAELTFEQQPSPDAPGLIRCFLQTEPARRLPRLRDIPILSVAGEASFAASREHSLQKYLAQAGVAATFVRLEDVGITGNGHLLMSELNNHRIAAFLDGWIAAVVETEPNRSRLAARATVVEH